VGWTTVFHCHWKVWIISHGRPIKYFVAYTVRLLQFKIYQLCFFSAESVSLSKHNTYYGLHSDFPYYIGDVVVGMAW